ncbi:MAG: PAS domain S-box protein [Rhodomicrobium sp.]
MNTSEDTIFERKIPSGLSAGGQGRAPRRTLLIGLAWFAGVGLLYFLAARLALPLVTPEGVAQFWPAAGIAVGALIVAGDSALIPITLGVAAASIAANGLDGSGIGACLAFALGNTATALLAAMIVRLFGRPIELDRLRNVIALFVAAAVGTAPLEAVAALLLKFAGRSEAPFALIWGRLVWTNITGIAMLAPLAIGLAAAVRKLPQRAVLIEGSTVLLLHALVTLHAFGLFLGEHSLWMQLIPLTSQLPVLLWLALRCGPLFAAAGTTVLGLSIIVSIEAGQDRFSGTAFPIAARVFAAQYSVLAMSFVALVIAALIAERKSAELVARRNQSRFKLGLDAGNFGTWELDPESGTVHASARARLCFGLPSGSPVPVSDLLSVLHPADRQLCETQLRKVAGGGGDLDSEWRAIRADGSVRWLHVMGRAAGDGTSGQCSIAGAVRDITEQKAMAALKESAGQMRLFVDQAPVAIAMFDPEMRYLAASRRWIESYKLSPKGLIGRSHFELFPDVPAEWQGVYRRAMDGEVVSGDGDPVTRPSGRTQWLRWEVRPWREANGAIGGIVIFTEDVTQRVEAERALRESRRDLDRAQAVARTGSWRLDVHRNELTWSAETYRIFGIPPDTPLTYESFLAAVHAEDRERVDHSWKAAVAGAAYDLEHRIVADNETKWVRERAELDFDANGKLLSGFGTVQDITDKKAAEEQLLHQRRLTEVIGDRAADAIFLTDEAGCITYANPEAERAFGFEPWEMEGQNLHELLHHHYADGSEFPRGSCPMSKIQETGATVRNHEDVFFRKDGWPVQVSCSYAPLEKEGRRCGAVFVVRDISAQKAAQAALRDSEERLRLSNEAAGIGTFTVDLGSGRAYYSAELAETLGFPGISTAQIDEAFARVHKADLAAVQAKYQAGLSGAGDGRIRMEFRFVRPGGEIRWLTWTGRVDFRQDPAGRVPFRVVGACVDITEHMRAEEALRASEERFRAIVGTAVDAIVVIDEKGEIQSINPAGERMFGYTSEEITGRNVSMLMPEPQHSEHDSYIASYRQTGIGKIIPGGRETKHLRKDGSIFSADLSVAEWHAGGERYFTGIVRDISERKRQSEKVQLLLREVNHRAKNMLALVQAIASRTAAPDHAEFMKRFSERLSALAASQDLLVGSGWQGAAIEALVRSQLSHFKSLIDDRIRLKGPALHLSASAAQTIGMALHELATNAGKYGALSSGSGGIEIAWRLVPNLGGSEQFHMIWAEHGGPPAAPPRRAGFGTTVIETIPRMELDAEIMMDYTPEGLHWCLRCPAESVLEIQDAGIGTAPAAR